MSHARMRAAAGPASRAHVQPEAQPRQRNAPAQDVQVAVHLTPLWRTGWLLLVFLLLLGSFLGVAWTPAGRWQAAGQITDSICGIRPQPHACAPDGSPSEMFGWLLEHVG